MPRGKKAVEEVEEKSGRGRPAKVYNIRELEAEVERLENKKGVKAEDIEKAKRKLRRVKRNAAKKAGTYVPRGERKAKVTKGKAAKAQNKAAKKGRKVVTTVEADEDEDDEED